MLSAKSFIILAAMTVAANADHSFTLKNNCGFGVNMKMWVEYFRKFKHYICDNSPVSAIIGPVLLTTALSLLQSVRILRGALRFQTAGTVASAITVTATAVAL